MDFEIVKINHVCLVVQDIEAAELFYMTMLGLKKHHSMSSWYVLNDHSTLHLIEIDDIEPDITLFHEIQHFALQVNNLSKVVERLLEFTSSPFQMDLLVSKSQ